MFCALRTYHDEKLNNFICQLNPLYSILNPSLPPPSGLCARSGLGGGSTSRTRRAAPRDSSLAGGRGKSAFPRLPQVGPSFCGIKGLLPVPDPLLTSDPQVRQRVSTGPHGEMVACPRPGPRSLPSQVSGNTGATEQQGWPESLLRLSRLVA